MAPTSGKPDDSHYYRKIPALAAYIDRIGAEQLNFKTFMVKEFKGHYYTERVLIKINEDGDIYCNNQSYAPSKEEASRIKGAVGAIAGSFPKSVNASLARTKELMKSIKNTTYEFLTVNGDEVIMVQETFKLASGQKVYVPWTFWSDGVWRKMEPEGKLPFWKPPKKKGELEKGRIMIHEGAKAAKFVTDLIKNKERNHPWYEELINYRHWGMIGGALAPHRTDYGELMREKPTEVVYICDNDKPGRDALKQVSRNYGQQLKGVYFDAQWPESWDMAEEMPPLEKFDGKKIPSLESLMIPATMATEAVIGEKGKKTYVLRSTFAQKMVSSIKPEIYIHLDHPGKIWSAKQFNNLIRPYSDVDDTVRLIQMEDATKSAIVQYRPNMPSGLFTDSNGLGRFINTYAPSPIKAIEGSIAPFVTFMEHLFPIESDRKHMYDWVYNLITLQHHGCRPHFAVLLVSETQGVGKSTLGEKILAPLVGRANTALPSENVVVEGAFNDWMAYKVLAVIHEIYAGHSMKAYDRLKNLITESTVQINQKYQDTYEMDNWMHIFACSNSMAALRISNDDRRWFIPKVTEKTKGQSFWKDFNIWLAEEGGLEAIKWHAEDWLKKNGSLEHGMNAPTSEQKKVFIEDSYSSGMLLVLSALRRLRVALDPEDDEEAPLRRTIIQGKMMYLLEDKGGKETLRLISDPNPGKPMNHVRIETSGDEEDIRVVNKDGTIKLNEDEKLFSFFLDMAAIDLIKQKQYDGKHSDRLERPLTIRKVSAQEGWHALEYKLTIKDWQFNASRPILPYAHCKDWPLEMIWQREEKKGPNPKPKRLLKPVDMAMLHNDFQSHSVGNDQASRG